MLPISFNFCSILLYSEFSILFCRLFRQTSFLFILCLYKVCYVIFFLFFQFDREIIFFFKVFILLDEGRVKKGMYKIHELLKSLLTAVYLVWSSLDGGSLWKLHTFDDRQVEDAHVTLSLLFPSVFGSLPLFPAGLGWGLSGNAGD